MSTHSLRETLINPQTNCRLLLAPYDIRRTIYFYLLPTCNHVFLNEHDKLCLSSCDESPIEDARPEKKRCTGCVGEASPALLLPPYEEYVTCEPCKTWTSTWARRLRSSWGPHWKCEEDAKKSGCVTYSAMFLACKRLYIDVVEHLVKEATFSIDLMTLRSFSQREALGLSGTFSASGYLGSAFSNIRELHITLRLSLDECQEIERLTADNFPDLDYIPDLSIPSLKRLPPAVLKSRVTAWLDVHTAITQLKELRRLQIWIDHDDKSSWSRVNERAILHPLESLLSLPDLNMCISLPKLHPLWENPYRHYVQDNTMFKMHRRLRQSHHGREYEDGTFVVLEKQDFPILGNFWNDVEARCKAQNPQLEVFFYSPTEMESMERDSWLFGEDVENLDNGVLRRAYTPEEWLRLQQLMSKR
ncbi:hypothetical protein BU16DRAFT_619469 [Lophium mytilinum]|uniref:Uncharacterized protein n=1 Tax=Lophium mytilinum TaxID=390894 RepID=A0A6A6QQB1_9PEZI|nr:hypothetical protein BU16DRAFT_619469 [Lophium mytilinum]